MRVIDFHTHAFPDEIAARAIAKLEAESPWKAVAAGTVAGLLESMDSTGIEVSVLCTIATKPDQAKGILEWCRKIRSSRIVPLPSVHPDTPDGPSWVHRIAEAGFPGIKLHPMYQEFPADDERMDPIYGAVADTGLFIVFHCGLDIAYPPDDDRASPVRLASVVRRFPDLKVVCTHLGGWRMWGEVRKHLLGSGVHMETSFTLAELGPAKVAEIIRAHGPDRILFGTDWPWARQDGELANFMRLGLDEGQARGILCDNSARLLGL
jgi:hypothetical protein